jgi:hypothetical protein
MSEGIVVLVGLVLDHAAVGEESVAGSIGAC